MGTRTQPNNRILLLFTSFVIIGLLEISGPIPAKAHPVAFAKSTAIMLESDPGRTDFQLFYSFDYWLATGATYTRLTQKHDLHNMDIHVVTPQLNLLVKRWNRPSSQANLYATGGYGSYQLSNDDRNREAYRAGAQFDFETRRVYTLFKYERLGLEGKSEDIDSYTFRGGLAPYLGDFDELNIWFIAQASYSESLDKRVKLTPMLRFYYKNVLWELGSSLRGDPYLNFMIHL